uniref:DA-P36 family member n=1 Tax=Rhipicephalus appendiculatus TaxID=34631 RepID=A0A131YE56_RHIAP
MKKTVSLGLILFMVIPGNALSSPSTGKQIAGHNGAHNKLNLTEEVHKYTKNYIGKDIVYYSLKDKPENGESPTLTAKAGQLAFGNGCEKRLSTTKECSDLYMFYIYNGTITPFNLTIDLTLSYKGRRNNFVVDINDASYIYWNPDNITMYPNDTTNYSEEVGVLCGHI